MSEVSFKRITPTESRIFADGDYVGDVYRQDDILNPGQHYYVVHLSEDPRGPRRVHHRSRIRAVAQDLVSSHPYPANGILSDHVIKLDGRRAFSVPCTDH